MRLLHTSDWHLGRSLHGVDLLAHQAAFADHLVALARDEQVDAVVVAGDVYDRAVPPVEAVALLADTLARLAETTTVVLTSGNHDSPTRLGFGAALMRERVRLRTRVADLAVPVLLPGADAEPDVAVYGLPYLDPDTTRGELTGDGRPLLARSHTAVLGAATARVRTDLAARRAASSRPVRAVVAAHAFVAGATASESERDIRVGGVDQVGAQVFDGVDYVALGHLHGPQQVGAPAGTVARYCGSPLAYSFSERHQTKSTVLVDLAARGPVTVRLVPAPVPRALTELSAPLADLLGAVGEPHTGDWVKVVVTDQVRPADLYRRVRDRFPHALVVTHAPTQAAALVTASRPDRAADPLAVAADFVAHVTGGVPGPAEAAVLRRAYEDVLTAERSA